MVVAVTYIGYGLLVLLGGVMGYLRARSMASLVAGGLFGIALSGCGWAILQGSTRALFIAFALTVFLIAFFAARYVRTRKPMPALGVIALSLVALAVLFLGQSPGLMAPPLAP